MTETPTAPPAEGEELTLDAITRKRRRVRINHDKAPEGEFFEIRRMDDFGSETLAELAHKAEEMEGLFNHKEKLTPAKTKRLTGLLNELASQILIKCPPAVVAASDEWGKKLVVDAFFVVTHSKLSALKQDLGVAQTAGSAA